MIIGKMEENDINDAMLAAKPLGGWSCGSCQKNIYNMQSHLADY